MKRHISADKIEKLMTSRGIKPRALAERANLGQTYVRDILTGKSLAPSREKLAKIADELGCGLYELTGEAPPSRKEVASPSSEIAYIPEYNLSVAAGDGCAPPDLQDPARVWRIPSNALAGVAASSIGNLAIVTVRGDSMEPDYRPHEKILVDTGDKIIRNDGVYVLFNGVDLVVKMVQVLPPEKKGGVPSLVIISKNPSYPPYTRAASDIMVNGRVVGKWTWK